jgi:hypothetical protein
MEEAKERAGQDQLAEALREEAERRLGELGGAMDESAPDSAWRWLEWVYGFARAIDSLTRLPGMPNTREPMSEELEPHLKGWSPYSARTTGRTVTREQTVRRMHPGNEGPHITSGSVM